MIIVTLIILNSVLFIILAKLIAGNFKNHYTIFNLWWAIIVVFSFLELSPLNIPSSETYLVILVGSFSFNLSLLTFNTSLKDVKIDNRKYYLNFKLFILLQILTAYFIFPYFLKGLAISQEESLAYVKSGLGETFADSPIEVIKIYWFSQPIIISSMVIACFSFYFRKERNVYLIIFFTVLNIILFSIAFGGRIQMFRMCFILLILMFFRCYVRGNYKFTNRRIKVSYLLIGCFVFVMAVFTQSRSWDGNAEFYKNFNIYFIGSLSLLDYFLHNPDIAQFNHDLLFGRASFASFIDPFILFGSKALHIKSFSTDTMGVNIINKVGEEFYIVGDGYSMNAFSTMYYPFIRDFGFMGIVIFPFMLGCFFNILIKKALRSKSFYAFLVYILFCYIMVFASNRWEVVNFWPFGSMVYLFLLTYKFKSSKNRFIIKQQELNYTNSTNQVHVVNPPLGR